MYDRKKIIKTFVNGLPNVGGGMIGGAFVAWQLTQITNYRLYVSIVVFGIILIISPAIVYESNKK